MDISSPLESEYNAILKRLRIPFRDESRLGFICALSDNITFGTYTNTINFLKRNLEDIFIITCINAHIKSKTVKIFL